jgi:hypothetical protein
MRKVPFSALLALAVVLTVVCPPDVHATDGVAVIIEIRLNAGEVQVKRSDETAWRQAQPLLTLRPGDQINVRQDARVTLAFIGSRGTRVLGVADSPFIVVYEPPKSPAERARETVGAIVQFLIGASREPTQIPIAVRPGPPIRVAILSPRDSRLLPGPVTFEWTGSHSVRYRVRVLGPEGTVWEAGDVTLGQTVYPAWAPPLLAGVRYQWQLEAPNAPAQQAYFELLGPDQADRIRTTLDLLNSEGVSQGSRSGVVALRSGFLIQQGLYSEARTGLVSAARADPTEPTLHFLLGMLYEQAGLADMAGREFWEAHDLVSHRR